MKQELIPHVGADFMSDGERHFSFQLCVLQDRPEGNPSPRRMIALASIDFLDGKVVREHYSDIQVMGKKEIEKLARKAMENSIPFVAHKQ